MQRAHNDKLAVVRKGRALYLEQCKVHDDDRTAIASEATIVLELAVSNVQLSKLRDADSSAASVGLVALEQGAVDVQRAELLHRDSGAAGG